MNLLYHGTMRGRCSLPPTSALDTVTHALVGAVCVRRATCEAVEGPTQSGLHQPSTTAVGHVSTHSMYVCPRTVRTHLFATVRHGSDSSVDVRDTFPRSASMRGYV